MSDIDQLEHLAAMQKKTDEMIAKLTAPLRIEDVEFRVGSSYGGNCRVLAYKNARVDMRRLDDAVGQAGWQREHKCVDGHWFCRVGIRIGGEWVWKEDVGSESNFEAEKGAASDSFKRACFNWGIGRELYDYPHIVIAGSKDALKPQFWQWDADYDDAGKIKWLRGMDEAKEMFTWPHDNLPVNVYEHNDAVREYWDDVHAIKEAIENKDWPTVVEYSDGLEDTVKRKLWLATTKGGIFKTAERDALHGNDVSRARKVLRGEQHAEELVNE